MEYILNSLDTHPVFILTGAILLLLCIYAVLKKAAKALTVAAILLMMYIGYFLYQGREVPEPKINGVQLQQQLRSGIDQIKANSLEQLENVDVQIQLKPSATKQP